MTAPDLSARLVEAEKPLVDLLLEGAEDLTPYCLGDEASPMIHCALPATLNRAAARIKALEEAQTLIGDLAAKGADKAGCDGWRAQEMCRQIVQILARAALPDTGEG